MAGAMEQLVVFHKLERDCYHRLVRDLDQEPESMRWVMALWLWFESAGHHDFVRRVSALPGPVVIRFVDEAIACLYRLARREYSGPADNLLPCTNALLAEPIDDVGYFDDHRDEVMNGIAPLYKNVCLVIFQDVRADDDALQRMLASRGGALMQVVAGASPPLPLLPPPPPPPPAMMVAAAYAGSAPGYAYPTAPPSQLNAMATPWFPPPPVQQQNPLPDDYRSLFITFSRGYPISKEDITEFFDSVYGPCVEAVIIERALLGQLPVYGRVVLRSPAMIPVVLDCRETAKFMIKGRHLWARVYVPSPRPLPVYVLLGSIKNLPENIERHQCGEKAMMY